MKNIKSFLGAAMLFVLSLNTSFASGIDTEPTKNFETEVSDLIKEIDLKNYELESELIHVNFLINDKKEIIVLSTTTDALDGAIKSKLNYHTVESDDISMNRKYTIPVRIRI